MHIKLETFVARYKIQRKQKYILYQYNNSHCFSSIFNILTTKNGEGEG